MTTILITGANSGIGKGFVAKYLQRPNTTVIGSVRDTNSAGAKALLDLPKAEGSKLITVKIDSASDTDALEAIKNLQSNDKITKLDIVIANAGIYKLSAFEKVADIKLSDLFEHFNVNTAGPIRLFQATLPLLKKAEKPMLMIVSSGAGSITAMEHIPFAVGSYGASKAAMNFLTRKIHFENEGLIAFAVHPGSVKTEEGNAAARFFGFPEAETPVEASVDGLVVKLDAATRKETSGKFVSFDKTPLGW